MDSEFKSIQLVVKGTSSSWFQIWVRSISSNAVLLQNIPFYVTEMELKRHIAEIGGSLRTGRVHTKRFYTAKVQFKSSDGAKVLNNIESWDIEVADCGLSKWIQEYQENIVSRGELKQQIGAEVNKFEEARLSQNQNEFDEDENGWQVVKASTGSKKVFEQKESVVRKLEAKLEKDRVRGLPNFYSKQAREFKKSKLKNLKSKFEKDRKKVDFIKKENRFKPFSRR